MPFTQDYMLSDRALQRVRTKLDQMKLAGKVVTPTEMRAAYEAEMDSLQKEAAQNRALSEHKREFNASTNANSILASDRNSMIKDQMKSANTAGFVKAGVGEGLGILKGKALTGKWPWEGIFGGGGDAPTDLPSGDMGDTSPQTVMQSPDALGTPTGTGDMSSGLPDFSGLYSSTVAPDQAAAATAYGPEVNTPDVSAMNAVTGAGPGPVSAAAPNITGTSTATTPVSDMATMGTGTTPGGAATDPYVAMGGVTASPESSGLASGTGAGAAKTPGSVVGNWAAGQLGVNAAGVGTTALTKLPAYSTPGGGVPTNLAVPTSGVPEMEKLAESGLAYGDVPVGSMAGVGAETAGMGLSDVVPFTGPIIGGIKGGIGSIESGKLGGPGNLSDFTGGSAAELTNVAGKNEEDIGGGIVAGAASGASIGSIFPGIGTAIGGVVGGIVGGVSELLGDNSDTIVCSELNRQGYLPRSIMLKDSEYRKRCVPAEAYTGYLMLFTGVVRRMKTSKSITALIRPFGVAAATEMAHRVDSNVPCNLLGKVILCLGIPICKWYFNHKAYSKSAVTHG